MLLSPDLPSYCRKIKIRTKSQVLQILAIELISDVCVIVATDGMWLWFLPWLGILAAFLSTFYTFYRMFSVLVVLTSTGDSSLQYKPSWVARCVWSLWFGHEVYFIKLASSCEWVICSGWSDRPDSRDVLWRHSPWGVMLNLLHLHVHRSTNRSTYKSEPMSPPSPRFIHTSQSWIPQEDDHMLYS